MSKGNDATPTWSGFNYQGKIMILHVLKLINEIQKNADKGIYSVEIEKTEDFSIICDSEYKSFHQVKAWLSASKWSSYAEAMDKLLEHRNKSSNPTGKCYLMVARNIVDWDEAANTYQSNIELYKYDSKIIGVCDVRNAIIQEVKKYLKAQKYSENNADIVYGELCLFLDDVIAQMHKTGAKKREYVILFSGFVDVMERAVKIERNREEYYLKEKIYDYFTDSMEKAFEGVCQDICGKSASDCSSICAAKTVNDKVMEISDYTLFCKVLNPSKIEGWDNSLSLVENFPTDKLQDQVYELMYHSKTPEKILSDGKSIYLQSKFSSAVKGQIIPTLLDLTRGCGGRSEALQRIFQNIVNNTDIIDILEGNSITVIPGGSYKKSLSQAQITSGWKDSNPEKKISSYYKDIELISSKELFNKFEENGGNND